MSSLVVLGGGPSSEHEVSLQSAGEMLSQLRAGGHAVRAIHIDRDNRWCFGDQNQNFAQLAAPDGPGASHERLSLEAALQRLRSERALVVVGLHGRFGEDGQLQRLLEEQDLRFTGSGSQASAIGMDKQLSKLGASKVGARCASHELVESGKPSVQRLLKTVGLPCVVKPAAGGSSVGVSRVREEAELAPAILRARAEDPAGRVLVESWIEGTEVTCAVLRYQGQVRTLPLVAIRPASGHFYDYQAKYLADDTQLECPAKLPEATCLEIETVSAALFAALELRGVARVDFIVATENHAPIFLEVNTLPGFTSHSLVPRAALTAGLSRLDVLHALLADPS
ncbi:MAG: D-alanine--D-alanine ligase family protein [Planctomycetota bacterium]